VPPLYRRIGPTLERRLPPRLIPWVRRLADSLDRQLRASGAVPHRALAAPIARWAGFSRAGVDTLGAVLDLVQLAIDVADNVADLEQDRRDGRAHVDAYDRIPRAAAVCVPALLVGVALCRLGECFPAPAYRPLYGCRRLLEVLGDMSVGQGEGSQGAARVDLVSGRQGLLLCLPCWLRGPGAGHVTRRRTARLEAWAFAFGRTWEHHQRYLEERSAAAYAGYRSAAAAAAGAWPDFGPFTGRGPLRRVALIPTGLC
jgi:hypothetical protein